MDDPYTTLGVKRDASQDDIRRAYRGLAKKHHPDLNPGNAKAEDRFKTISAANELLSDVAKRARFDAGEIDAAGQERPPQPSYRDYAEGAPGRRYSPAGPDASGWNAQDLGDMFGSMFGGDHRSRGDGPARGQDERYSFTTDFLDAVTGATRRLTLPDGRTLDVKLPPGTSDGQVLRLRGQGGAGWNGGTTGDALVEIAVAPHRFFTRDGNDVRLELPVTLTEAVLGGPVEVPTPNGPVRMRVPAGSDTGTELRLRGRGVPAHAGQDAGDLYATLRVVLGKPDAALETFLQTWKPEHPGNPRHSMEADR
jgi:DnaJ-class molecular chaperone